LLIARLPLTRQLFIIASYLRPELIHFCAFPAAFFGKFFRREKQAKKSRKTYVEETKTFAPARVPKVSGEQKVRKGTQLTDFPLLR